ncbi:MAG: purH [Gammaproteobacteria bacterium]|jgi:phosphoribosylaminoimidazolecarboxamide formyltransferase/IMP cyclohydrolase|nr:purH [Gammaproteobacteria bacterium]
MYKIAGMNKPIHTALLSVSDKTGIVELARALISLNIAILSTGGTAKQLIENGINVTEVSDYTGYAEMMNGRVKTLHPKIYGGILARGSEDDIVMAEHGIERIDLVVVNLYPFQRVTASRECTLSNAIEYIDIGGPAMIRAAAKNFEHVAVVVNPDDYALIIDALKTQGGLSLSMREACAYQAFAKTAEYDRAIAAYLEKQKSPSPAAAFEKEGEIPYNYPEIYSPSYLKIQNLRYGENPHQSAAFYRDPAHKGSSVTTAILLQGKPLSFNNIADADSAYTCVKALDQNRFACVIVKHANPCGAAVANTLSESYQRAFITDPISAFGGIIAFNKPLDEATVSAILDNQFCEVIIAPGVNEKAKLILAKKSNLRVLVTPPVLTEASPQRVFDYKKVEGGLLLQTADLIIEDPNTYTVVTRRKPTDKEFCDLLFSWTMAKYVKSNAIVYGRDNATVGIGAGQMSRVVSAEIANRKASDAKLSVSGAVMASDAFFPFRDGIDTAASAGITAVIQPGGSIRDDEVIAAADEANMAMIFTHIRHFRHT